MCLREVRAVHSMIRSRASSTNGAQTVAPPSRPVIEAVRSTLRLIQVRLRIPAILVISAVIAGQWDVICNYWDKLARRSTERGAASHPVSNDTEYFCPMDPGVVSDWPGKCGICNMALVRRKKGEAVALPDGVVARMQISPYRIQLAGIRTEPLAYRPLQRHWETAGIGRRSGDAFLVPIEIPVHVAPWISESQPARVHCRDFPSDVAIVGQLYISSQGKEQGGDREATVTVADSPGRLSPGKIVDITLSVPAAELE